MIKRHRSITENRNIKAKNNVLVQRKKDSTLIYTAHERWQGSKPCQR
jgi:hypothetical protein